MHFPTSSRPLADSYTSHDFALLSLLTGFDSDQTLTCDGFAVLGRVVDHLIVYALVLSYLLCLLKLGYAPRCFCSLT
jgi:hypothetical protein